MDTLHPHPAPMPKVVDLGDKTGSPCLYPDNGDDGRGRHIKKAKELS